MKYFKPLLFSLLPILPAITHLPGNGQPGRLPPDSLRMVLPLSIDYDGHIVTPFVNITVNGKLFKTVFDTGSSGLRMMNGALPAAPPVGDSRNTGENIPTARIIITARIARMIATTAWP